MSGFRNAEVSDKVDLGLVVLQKHLCAIRIYLSKCGHGFQGNHTGK